MKTLTTVFYWAFPAVVVGLTVGFVLATDVTVTWLIETRRLAEGCVGVQIPVPCPTAAVGPGLADTKPVNRQVLESTPSSTSTTATPSGDGEYYIDYYDAEVQVGFRYRSSWGPLQRQPLPAKTGKAIAFSFENGGTPRMVFATPDFQQTGYPIPQVYTGVEDPVCSTLPANGNVLECENFSDALGVPARAYTATHCGVCELNDEQGYTSIRIVEAVLPIEYSGAEFDVYSYLRRDPASGHVLPDSQRAFEERVRQFHELLRSLTWRTSSS